MKRCFEEIDVGSREAEHGEVPDRNRLTMANSGRWPQVWERLWMNSRMSSAGMGRLPHAVALPLPNYCAATAQREEPVRGIRAPMSVYTHAVPERCTRQPECRQG